MNPDPSWRPLASEALAWRSWDGELVVYNDVTGNTHHLSALGRAVMTTLLSHPSGIALTELVRAVAEDGAADADAELVAAVERTLADLAGLELVAPVHA